MNNLIDYGREGRTLPLADIIDMHGHLGDWVWYIPDLTPGSLVSAMDRIGVKSILCSHMQCMNCDLIRANREVLAAMREYPGRILGYFSVWPWAEEDVKAEVARCIEAGFTGAKMHNHQGFSYTYPRFAPVYEAAEMHHLPVLFHTYSNEKNEFSEISEIAAQYPNASIIAAHARVLNERGYVALANKHSNIFLDTVISACPRGLIERLVTNVGADRIVWGSDVYCYSQAQQIGKILGAKITEEDKIKILSGNALRILAQRRP